MTKDSILERAKQVMKREKVDAEKAWAIAVAELTIEEMNAQEKEKSQKVELDHVITEGKKVVGELKKLLEDDND